MNDKFIYDEKTSVLFSPNGEALKRVYCPRALKWNQLEVLPEESRWRNCEHCEERVIDLDVVDVDVAVKMLSTSHQEICVHASKASGKVIFLKDQDAVPPAANSQPDENGRMIIRTARSEFAINRAASIGYWPDVRFVIYQTDNLRSKISVGQHTVTGHIKTSGDYRLPFVGGGEIPWAAYESIYGDDLDRKAIEQQHIWAEVVPFTNYYPNYQLEPIAAYLIPKHLADGTLLTIADPIEDFVGGTWSQGSAWRATDLSAILSARKVVIDPQVQRGPNSPPDFIG